jgi:hypothetical protein
VRVVASLSRWGISAGRFDASRTVGTLILPTTISRPSLTMVWNLTMLTSSGTDRVSITARGRFTHDSRDEGSSPRWAVAACCRSGASGSDRMGQRPGKVEGEDCW